MTFRIIDFWNSETLPMREEFWSQFEKKNGIPLKTIPRDGNFGSPYSDMFDDEDRKMAEAISSKHFQIELELAIEQFDGP